MKTLYLLSFAILFLTACDSDHRSDLYTSGTSNTYLNQAPNADSNADTDATNRDYLCNNPVQHEFIELLVSPDGKTLVINPLSQAFAFFRTDVAVGTPGPEDLISFSRPDAENNPKDIAIEGALLTGSAHGVLNIDDHRFFCELP